MITADVTVLERSGTRLMAHDRKASADVGYRVWNPFEAELRVEAVGRRDDATKSFVIALDVIER
jgi:hypothetical protein